MCTPTACGEPLTPMHAEKCAWKTHMWCPRHCLVSSPETCVSHQNMNVEMLIDPYYAVVKYLVTLSLWAINWGFIEFGDLRMRLENGILEIWIVYYWLSLAKVEVSSVSKNRFICKLKGLKMEYVKTFETSKMWKVSIVSGTQRVGKNWLFVI